MTLARVDHLYRYYQDRCAVEDVSFAVERGEVLGFLGPNGAGKSTTMQILAGNLAPSRGRITVQDIDMLDEPKRAKAHLGYLPEHPPVYRDMTVDEYLGYCARLHRIARAGLRTAVERAKERCGLGAVGRRLIGNLSKGFQQRVGIAQAILHEPALVILDEPTVGLDPIQIRDIRALIRELGRGHGVILSTHILPEVQATCSRVQIIHEGRLVFSDTIDGLAARGGAGSIVLGLRRPPDADALAALPGVADVEPIEAGRFRLRLSGADAAEGIADAAARGGWGLVELVPERASLEQIFVDLTVRNRTDVQEPAAA